MPARTYAIGLRFGKLQIIEEAEPYIHPNGSKRRKVLCLCDCGNKKVFQLDFLKDKRSKIVKSCGCAEIAEEVATGDNFWKQCTITDSGCWEWKLGKNNNGYGAIWIDGKHKYAHRHAYELKYGPIPEGMCACHKCDNPGCVNPDHIFIGDIADNTRDAAKKKRLKSGQTLDKLWATKWKDRKGAGSLWSGEKSPTHKLTNELVIEMRKLYDAEGWGYKRLHKKFGVSVQVCKRIVKRKMWQNI